MSTTPQALKVSITFTSDWQIGLGAGRHGEADRMVARDADGLPFVPAKSLTGIWRDACERVARALDLPMDGGWTTLLDRVFGSQPTQSAPDRTPSPACLSIRPARFPVSIRRALLAGSARGCRDSLTFLKPGVAIDPETGFAKTDHLRLEEVVRGGCTLEADVELEVAEAEREAALSLLWAGARTIERIGGKRRRGRGRCSVTLVGGIDNAQALRILAAKAPKSTDSSTDNPSTAPQQAAATLDGWMRLQLRLETIDPIVVPERTLGNVVLSRDRVPGTYLLGAVTAALGGLGVDLFPHVVAGDLQVLDATPEVGGARGLPVPFALFHEKEAGGLDKGRKVWNRLEEAPAGSPQLKGHREGFVGPSDKAAPILERVPLGARTHNSVDDEPQRPTSEVGGVYTYESIPAGTVLRSELRLRASLAAALTAKDGKWHRRLERRVRLGQSKKDDYGRAEMAPIGEPTAVAAGASRNESDPTLYLWLQSDLLLRDRRLRPTTRPEDLAEYIGEQLGMKKALTVRKREGRILSLVARPSRTEGWVASWGLPRPSLVGYGAGSCFAFTVQGSRAIDPTAIAELERSGLGERRAEGFGRVVFDFTPIWAESEIAKGDEGNGGTADKRGLFLPADDPHLGYARILEREALRREMRLRVQSFASDHEKRRSHFGWTERKPENSQLGALRMMIATLDGNRDDRVKTWLARIAKKEERESKPIETASGLIKNRDTIWTWLDLAGGDEVMQLTVGGFAEAKQVLWAEAVRALVNASVQAETRKREDR